MSSVPIFYLRMHACYVKTELERYWYKPHNRAVVWTVESRGCKFSGPNTGLRHSDLTECGQSCLLVPESSLRVIFTPVQSHLDCGRVAYCSGARQLFQNRPFVCFLPLYVFRIVQLLSTSVLGKLWEKPARLTGFQITQLILVTGIIAALD